MQADEGSGSMSPVMWGCVHLCLYSCHHPHPVLLSWAGETRIQVGWGGVCLFTPGTASMLSSAVLGKVFTIVGTDSSAGRMEASLGPVTISKQHSERPALKQVWADTLEPSTRTFNRHEVRSVTLNLLHIQFYWYLFIHLLWSLNPLQESSFWYYVHPDLGLAGSLLRLGLAGDTSPRALSLSVKLPQPCLDRLMTLFYFIHWDLKSSSFFLNSS